MCILKIGRTVVLLMRKFRVLILFLLVGVMPGCSIKEERDGCPCRLFLDMTSVDAADQAPFMISIFSEDGVVCNTVLEYNDFADTCVFDVPRSKLDVVVWSGGGKYLDSEGLTIPLGDECPPVFIHQGRLDARGETVYDRVILHKNYCILSVNLVGSHMVKRLTLRGAVSGFDKVGNPVPGDFCVHSQWYPVTSGRFYIPKQSCSPLYLDVMELDGMTRTFPLHDYMAEYGYEPDGGDLCDLNMSLSYTPVGITLTIQGWDEEIVINIAI